MLKFVTVSDTDEEVHQNCIRCNGKKKHQKILQCSKEGCVKMCHLKCRSKEFNALCPQLRQWFCDKECGTILPVIELSTTSVQCEEIPPTTGTTKQVIGLSEELKWEQQLHERDIQLQELLIALQTATTKSKELQNEYAAYKLQSEEEIQSLKAQLEAELLRQAPKASSSEPQAIQLDHAGINRQEILTANFKQIMKDFNSTFNANNSEQPDVTSSPIQSTSKSAQQFFPSAGTNSETDGHSSATLIARERIRKRREKDKMFSSMDPHAQRSDKDLARLKLARQNLDELTKFKGDRLEWIAFEEEVYTFWDGGEYTDYEMIKKLRKALEGDAKAYVKLALSATEANPELVMETLRRKYYHPNEAVSQALKEITSLEAVRKKVRKPLESVLTAVENYIHVCRLVKIQQHLQGRVNGEVEGKLPPELRADWNKLIRTGSSDDGSRFIGNWIEFWSFLRDSVEDLPINFETYTPNTSKKSSNPAKRTLNQLSNSNSQKGRKPKGNSSNDKLKCPFDDCDKGKLYHCTGFWALPYADKMKFAKERKFCTRCANSTTHVAKECPYTDLVCRASGCTDPKTHASVFHPPKGVLQCINQGHGFTAFQVLPIYVFDKTNKPVQVLAFLDSGSDTTIMNESCFDLLQLPSQQYQLEVGWCAAGISSIDKASRIFDCQIASIENPQQRFHLKDVVTMRNFKLPQQSQDPQKLKKTFPHLKKVPIPAYGLDTPQILIGLQQRHLMTSDKVVRAADCPIVAEKTALGWTVSGSIRPRRNKNVVLQSCLSRDDSREELTLEELNTVIRKFIDEDISIVKEEQSGYLRPDEKRTNELLKKHMKCSNRRYYVPLFWATDDVELPDNYSLAETRLLAQELRLQKLGMVDWANEHIKMLLDRGFMRRATKEDLEPKVPHKNVNYVPGFVTFNHNKIPPKPRWVVDPAAKFRGTSLNSVLLKGVDNLVPLTQALFHFRERKYATVADVEKMYHQVMINPEDQNCQRVLWRWCDTTKKPEIFVHQAMMFGPTDSPSKANAVRIDHATKRQQSYPNGARVALDSMYMDDGFNSEDDVPTAIKTASEQIDLFDEIGWRFVDVRSNSSKVLKGLPKDRVNLNFAIDLAKDETIDKYKVLGIFWDPVRDAFIFKQTAEFELKAKTQNDGYVPTKREVLSFIMRIFDPLGLISHFIVRGRMIMQQTWAQDLDWLSKITENIQGMWKQWLSDLDRIALLVIPRHYKYISTEVTEVSLHMFSDAGADGFATIAYFRFVFSSGKVHVQQVASKSKVSPIRYLSIAKKELSAAVASVNLARVVKQQHKRLNIKYISYYVDSEVTLKWIRNPTIKLMQYVAPRVTQIWEETAIRDWHYVPTKENPADFGTKWKQMAIDYSDSSHMWFQGPLFLWQEHLIYPDDSGYPLKKDVHHVMVIKPSADEYYYAGVLDFIKPTIRADWLRFIAAVAGISRFIHNTNCQINKKAVAKITSQIITPEERESAIHKIIINVQQAYWPDAFKSLIAGRFIRTNKSADLNPLCPIIGNDGLLRCTTRMSHDDSIPYNKRFPLILPAKHEVTDAIVTYYHIKFKHINQDAVISTIREKYWIIHARQAVRRVSAKCPYCKLKRARPYQVTSAPLPLERTQFTSKAFENTGVDVFGPFTVYTRKSKSSRKVWVVIFCCLITRAVYLRMIDSLSSDEMMLAIQDLWTRRGSIKLIMSDNGLNFVGCAAILKNEHLTKLAREKSIQWKFNPPYTPQWGGAWERLIRDIKRAMKFAIGDTTVGEKTFQAILLQTEDCMNSRPLTHLPISPLDDEPLTPNKLISMHPGNPLVLDEAGEIDAHLTIKKAQWFANQIRRRWVREYLPIIAKHPAKGLKKSSLKEGDYVIYIDPLMHPSKWPKGVVKNLYPGRDNIARVADVLLKDGSLLERRSALRLAKIESSARNTDNDDKLISQLQQLSLNNGPSTFPVSCSTVDTVFESHANTSDSPDVIQENSAHEEDEKILNCESIMKPTPHSYINLAKKLQAATFYNKIDLLYGSTAEIKGFLKILEEQKNPRDIGNNYTLKLAGFPLTISILDLITWLLNNNIRPTWIKCDSVARKRLHIFVRSNDQQRHDAIIRDNSLNFNGIPIAASRPIGEVDYINERGLEHTIVAWTYNELYTPLDMIISRAYDSDSKQKALQVLNRDNIKLLTRVSEKGIKGVEWNRQIYDVDGRSAVKARIGLQRATQATNIDPEASTATTEDITRGDDESERAPKRMRSVVVIPQSSTYSNNLRITVNPTRDHVAE